MLRSDTLQHFEQQHDDFKVFANFLLPRYIVHIFKKDFVFLLSDSEVLFILISIYIFIIIYRNKFFSMLITLDVIKCCLHVFSDTIQSKTERVDRGFQTFQQLHIHKSLNTLFAFLYTQAMSQGAFFILVFIEFAWQDKCRRSIDSKMQQLKLLKYLVVVNSRT